MAEIDETQLDEAVERVNSRLKELYDELDEVRAEIRKAYRNTNVSLGQHSLNRQPISVLESRESKLTWDIQECLQGGPFGSVIIEGRDDYKYLTRASVQ